MSVTTTNKHRVIKRPARGFHRFRSGVLNVTPKAGEKNMVKENQNSPLLRLPSEIRGCIWKYALGSKVFLAASFAGRYYSKTYKFAPSALEPKNGMALIRTCRQIYSEAVLYPLNTSTFACNNTVDLKRALKALRNYQRKQITHLRLDCAAHNAIWWLRDCRFSKNNLDLKKTFPALTRVTILIHGVTDAECDAFEAAATSLRQRLRHTLEVTGADLIVRGIPDEVESYLVNEVNEEQDEVSMDDYTQE